LRDVDINDGWGRPMPAESGALVLTYACYIEIHPMCETNNNPEVRCDCSCEHRWPNRA
jgi:hypothetical protein